MAGCEWDRSTDQLWRRRQKFSRDAPGSPWENGYVESFNARLRDELLDGEIFYTISSVRCKSPASDKPSPSNSAPQ
jgi:transposase InsO family protein